MPPNARERFSFTDRRIRSLESTPGKWRYCHDEKVRGLVLAISPRGVKSFQLYRWLHGRPQRMTLGRFGELAVEDARKAAAELNRRIARGEDPSRRVRAVSASMTLGELWARYLEEHAKVHNRSWRNDESQWRLYLEKSFANRTLAELTRADVMRIHAAIGRDRGRYAANRVVALLGSMFSRAAEWGFAGENPARGIRRFKESKRDRFVLPAEMPRLFAALEAEQHVASRDAILLLLFTGARLRNLLEMQWQDVALDRRLWRIPLTKSGEWQDVILSDPAIAVLARRRQERNGSPFVFPGQSRAGHMVDIRPAWNRIRTAAGLQDVRLHDLRRTLGSWQAITGASLPIIGKTLGHRDVATTAIYARLDESPVRAAVAAATRAMLSAGSGEPGTQ